MVAEKVAAKRVWVLPIVLLVAVLMVLPASTVLAARAGRSTSSSGVAPTVPSIVTGSGSSPVASSLSVPFPHESNPAASLGSMAVSSFPSSPSAPAFALPFTGRNGESPSSLAGTSSLSSRLATINQTFAKVPGAASEAAVERLIAEGTVPARAAYLPNLNLLAQPATFPVSPTYGVSPAPMGIADFGLGQSGAYTVYTPSVLGSLELNGYNASAGPLYQDTGAYYWDGLSPNAEATPWQSGVQLNTVVTNVSYPGANTGVFWTQNVVDFSGSTLQFIDNVWNFTGPDAAMNWSTLYSYNGTWEIGSFYYCYGPTLPLSFPLTLALYNNVSVVNDRTTVTFGYRVTEGTTVYTGIYDTVVFNSQPTSLVPLLTPDYLIDGYEPAYTVGPYEGPLYDAELVFGGPGGGSNAVVNSLDGAMSLTYLVGSTWTPAEAAYDYGADTGETAIGVAGWWQGSTEYVNQGPSMLYGLWNTTGGVPSGNVEFVVLPGIANGGLNYAFTFVGASGTSDWNLSYAPSDVYGDATMWLPPLASGYDFTFFADGWDQSDVDVLGLPAGTVDYVEPVMTPDLGMWNAPIYMDGPAQAAMLATDALGWTSGPYAFEDLPVYVNLTFNHLNDWGFPEFDLFWAYDIGYSLVVNNVTQGPDSAGSLCAGTSTPSTCYLEEFPFGYANLPSYGSEIADWDGAGAEFVNLFLEGYYMPSGLFGGGAVSLWDVTDAYAYNITSYGYTYGVWAASSPDLEMVDSFSIYAASLTLADSPGAYAYNLSTFLFGAAIVDWGSAYGDFTLLNSTYGSYGFSGMAANYTSISNVVAVEAAGVAIEESNSTTILGVDAYVDSTGVFGFQLQNTTVGFVFANQSSIGAELEAVANTTAGYFAANASSEGLLLFDSYLTSAFEMIATNDSLAIGLEVGTSASVSEISAFSASFAVALVVFDYANVTNVSANASLGVEVLESFEPIGVRNVSATNGSLGVLGVETEHLTVNNVTAQSNLTSVPSTAVALNSSEYGNVSNVSASGLAYGVNLTDDEVANVAYVTATGESIGVLVSESSDIEVAHVVATDAPSVAVGVIGSGFVTVLDVRATDATAGVVVMDSEFVAVANTVANGPDLVAVEVGDSAYAGVWNTSASNGSIGVWVNRSTEVSVTYTNATQFSVGVVVLESNSTWVNDTEALDWSVGVGVALSSDVSVLNVTASDPWLTTPWTSSLPFKVPVTAVLTMRTNDTTVANVVATSYPIALYDNASVDLFVEGVSAANGGYGLMLNGTMYSLFDHVSASNDQVGVLVSSAVVSGVTVQAIGNIVEDSSFVGEGSYGVEVLDASYGNIVTSSRFVDDGSYGVAFFGTSYDNLVYNNDFIGDNGATDTYNATHLQAYSSEPSNAFNNTDKVGNYWADWHTYANGVLAPYYVGTGAWDYHPLGAPEGTFAVTFTEAGLPSGTSWSVTLNGTLETTVGSSIVFYEYPGTYAYTVSGIANWSISPSSGSVVVSTAAVNVTIGFSELYTVTFSESGLSADTSWSVVLNGVLESGTGPTLNFSVVGGTYSYTVLAPSGWAAAPSTGTVSVGANYLVPVTFTSTVPLTYTVTIEESGLASGTSWSAIFNGVEKTTTGPSLTYTVTAGTYAYQVGSVAGYTVSPSSGTATVGGAYVIGVTYASTAIPTVTVEVHESGLATGSSWGAYVDGTYVSGTASTLSFTVPENGEYAYQIVPVANYSVSPSSGSVAVGTTTYTIGVTFTPVTYAVTFSESGLASGTSWTVTVNGVTYPTSGTSVTLDLGNGSYSYRFGNVSGYTLSVGAGTVKVSGSSTGVAVSYGSVTTPSYVKNSTFNVDWAVALGVAVIAIVIALVALLRKPRAPAPAPAAAWREPAGGQGSGGSSP